MKALRLGFPWQGGGLLLALMLWSFLPAPSASQDLASQLHALKNTIPESQRRIASSVRNAAQIVAQRGVAAARTQLEPMLHVDGLGAVEAYIYTSTLTPATLATLQQHGVRVLQRNEKFNMVYATVAFSALESVAALPFVNWIGAPVYGVRRWCASESI